MNRVLTLGRIVRYESFDGERAALVAGAAAAVENGPVLEVDLVVFDAAQPHGTYVKRAVPFDAKGSPGTWRWPPRESPVREAVRAACAPLTGATPT